MKLDIKCKDNYKENVKRNDAMNTDDLRIYGAEFMLWPRRILDCATYMGCTRAGVIFCYVMLYSYEHDNEFLPPVVCRAWVVASDQAM